MATHFGLPLETLLLIFEHAAVAYVVSDRNWAVQLAAVSKSTCNAVRPTLCRNIVMSDRNIHHFKDLPPFEHVFRWIRSLSIYVSIWDEDRTPAIVVYAFMSQWTPAQDAQVAIHGPWPVCTDFFQRLDRQGLLGQRAVGQMSISYEIFAWAVCDKRYGMQDVVAQNLARIDGYLPTTFKLKADGPLVSPTEWTCGLLDALPRLTYLSLRATDDFGYTSRRDALPEIVGAALQHRAAIQIVITIGGIPNQGSQINDIDLMSELEGIISQGRVKIWFDTRLGSSDGVRRADLEDAWNRRDIWTMPPPT